MKNKTNTQNVKASRLWTGKNLEEAASSSSDSEEDQQEIKSDAVKLEEYVTDLVKTESIDDGVARRERARMNAVTHDEEEMAYESEDEEEEDEVIVHRVKTESVTYAAPIKRIEVVLSEEESEDESESENESEPETILKPVFTPRDIVKTKQAIEHQAKEDTERKERDRIEKKQQSHQLAAEEIKRAITQKSSVPNVDDTDGLAPEEEHENWRVREFTRIKRDKEQQNERDEEIMDIERRRLMTDTEIAAENKRDNPEQEKESMQFLQRYYHKGAFFADDLIMKRDYNQATLDDHVNKKALPEIMQVKKFGLHGRTKWTHLAQEDTTNPDEANKRAQAKIGTAKKQRID